MSITLNWLLVDLNVIFFFSLGKCCQDLSRAGNFHDTTTMSLIKSNWFYFRRGGGGEGFSLSRQYR